MDLGIDRKQGEISDALQGRPVESHRERREAYVQGDALPFTRTDQPTQICGGEIRRCHRDFVDRLFRQQAIEFRKGLVVSLFDPHRPTEIHDRKAFDDHNSEGGLRIQALGEFRRLRRAPDEQESGRILPRLPRTSNEGAEPQVDGDEQHRATACIERQKKSGDVGYLEGEEYRRSDQDRRRDRGTHRPDDLRKRPQFRSAVGSPTFEHQEGDHGDQCGGRDVGFGSVERGEILREQTGLDQVRQREGQAEDQAVGDQGDLAKMRGGSSARGPRSDSLYHFSARGPRPARLS